MDLSFLMVFLKKYFVHPAKRQNFYDASGLKRNHQLKTCLIQTFPCILLPWAFPRSNIEDRFWQRPKDIFSLTQISLPLIPVDKLSLNLWENLMLTFHNLSPQCVMFRPEVISVLEEKTKARREKRLLELEFGNAGNLRRHENGIRIVSSCFKGTATAEYLSLHNQDTMSSVSIPHSF